MKHAGPVHHEEDEAAATPPAASRAGQEDGGLGIGGWVAIGGTLLAGAAAAIAVPLLRARRSAPVATRRGRKATVRKGKARKASHG
ncbi:hypothetical protein [Sphingomonas sp. CLY1604]|uniref:hypothetical protein n=1 Tax=Sphingomonas sp. CLY1604 TaxID=3457786 RepID=UPI003FD7B222